MSGYSKFEDLKGKHVFITGGSSGVGEGFVRGFINQGAKVSFVGISNKGEALSKELNGDTIFIKTDIKDINALQTSMRKAKDRYGDIDILINNAASDNRHEIANVSEEYWNECININLRPYFFTSKYVIGEMKKNGSGNIVNISSNSFLLGISGYPIYTTTKSAIVGLSKSLSKEFGSSGIRVNTLILGWVMTDKQKRLWADEKSLKECLKEQSIKRVIEVEDVVEPCLFLSSNASRMINGQTLIVDGGRV